MNPRAAGPGDDRWIQASDIRAFPRVRDAMLRNGDDKPMWSTESRSTYMLRTAENSAER